MQCPIGCSNVGDPDLRHRAAIRNGPSLRGAIVPRPTATLTCPATSDGLEAGRCRLVPGRPGPRVAVLAGGELVGSHAGLRTRPVLDMVEAEPVGQGHV